VNEAAIKWIQDHWDPDFFPNNQWIVVFPNPNAGTSFHFESLGNDFSFMPDVRYWPANDYESLVFCYVTFDPWQ
jgi:hypothetical protein